MEDGVGEKRKLHGGGYVLSNNNNVFQGSVGRRIGERRGGGSGMR